jgi:hypothetical protein
MYCILPLEHWDLEFESHSRHGCMYVFLLYLCCHVTVEASHQADRPTKKSYQISINRKSTIFITTAVRTSNPTSINKISKPGKQVLDSISLLCIRRRRRIMTPLYLNEKVMHTCCNTDRLWQRRNALTKAPTEKYTAPLRTELLLLLLLFLFLSYIMTMCQLLRDAEPREEYQREPMIETWSAVENSTKSPIPSLLVTFYSRIVK